MLTKKEYIDFVEDVESLGIAVRYDFSPLNNEGLYNIVFIKDNKIKKLYFPYFMRVSGQSHVFVHNGKDFDLIKYTNKQYIEDWLHNLKVYFEIDK